jgi:hypothetical protein
MRRDEDPLERYLWSARYAHDDFRPEYLTHYRAALHSLAAFLDRPPAERGSPNDVKLWAMADTNGLDPADVPLAQDRNHALSLYSCVRGTRRPRGR